VSRTKGAGEDSLPAGANALVERLNRFGLEGELLRQSLAHRSYCAEKPGQPSNERLELLGDAVVGLVITDHLYHSFPDLTEGDLARVKAQVVSTPTLAPVAAELGLGEAILLGKGEESSGGREKTSILADTLEAVIGAVYLASGYAGAADSCSACSAITLERSQPKLASATRRTACRSWQLRCTSTRRRT